MAGMTSLWAIGSVLFEVKITLGMTKAKQLSTAASTPLLSLVEGSPIHETFK